MTHTMLPASRSNGVLCRSLSRVARLLKTMTADTPVRLFLFQGGSKSVDLVSQ